MPGEVITIASDSYPDLAKIEDGESVVLKVTGTKNTNEDGDIEITTQSIAQTEVNPAKSALKDMVGPKNKTMMQGDSQEEDEGY